MLKLRQLTALVELSTQISAMPRVVPMFLPMSIIALVDLAQIGMSAFLSIDDLGGSNQ